MSVLSVTWTLKHRNMTQVCFTDGFATGQRQFLNIESFKSQLKSNWGRHQIYELIESSDQEVLPYFDRDRKLDHTPIKTKLEAEIESDLHGCVGRIATFVKVYMPPGFDMDNNLVQLSRHGPLQNGKFKVSFRFYILNCRVQMRKLTTMIRTLCQEDWWDTNPYHSANQKLGVPGGLKHIEDDKRLLDVFGTGGEAMKERAMSAIAQVVDRTSQLIGADVVEDDPAAIGLRRDAKRIKLEGAKSAHEPGFSRPDDWDEMFSALEGAGFKSPSYEWSGPSKPDSVSFKSANRGPNGCPCCKNQHDRNNWFITRQSDGRYYVKNFSERCKGMIIGECAYAHVMSSAHEAIETIVTASSQNSSMASALQLRGLTGTTEAGVDNNGLPCYLIQQHMESCPACSRHHTCPTYVISTLVRECYTLRNQSYDCETRILYEAIFPSKHGRSQMRRNPHLAGIFSNPCADVDYVELFASEHPDQYKSDGTRIYKFNGARWAVENPLQFTNDMQLWLRGIFRKLGMYIYLETQSNDNDSDHKKTADDYLAKINKVNGHIKSESGTQNLLKAAKRLLFDVRVEEVMDTNPYLIGFEDGIYDVKDHMFRAGKPEDMVSMSVGYNYPEAVDPDIEAEVLDFITKIYPVEEERNLFQRYAGYCLLGKHNEKVLLLLSDRRSGYNAKSSVISLLSAAMGEYAIKADPHLIYRVDKTRSVNDHQAGFLTYRKKRMLYIEETDPLKFLDEELIKDQNGGGTKFTVRPMYKDATVTFDWICKTIIAFNQGKMPSFNISDAALVNRMLTIPHRSRFYTEQVPSREFSFAADPNIKDKYPIWAPYFMRWAIEGLRSYEELGFRHLPEGCLEFKHSLIAERDIISQFLDDMVEPGGPMDFVQAKYLFNLYGAVHKDQQNDKRTRKTLEAFVATLESKFPEAVFQKRHKYNNQDTGRSTTANSVHVGLKAKPFVEDM